MESISAIEPRGFFPSSGPYSFPTKLNATLYCIISEGESEAPCAGQTEPLASPTCWDLFGASDVFLFALEATRPPSAL